ncbi:protein kinase domain-containing protein [Rhodococcus olei]
MSEDDPFPTARDITVPVTEDLSAVGFSDAEEIGRGGFGVVYRCTQASLDRTVAVKILTAELDADNRARFFREQRATGRLTGHPNIVTVLEAGATASGRPYLVMPYYPLDSLHSRIRHQGPLPEEAVLWIGVKIAGALDSAHRLGIVHRDVKPGNILLTDYGEPMLTDFGIAHTTGGFQTSPDRLTGSLTFTAPEVLEGEASTPAADVYGLGATLFCALTGHAAFERRTGENLVTQFLRITTQPVSDLREHGIAEDVSALIAAAMSRDRDQRPSATAFGEAIRQVQRRRGFVVDEAESHTEGTHAVPHRTAPRPGWSPLVAATSRGLGTLPPELTSFVDRRTELAEVKSLLSSARLVTLTGIGGVGKTRLALRAAATARRGFADGVWFVELADLSDPSLLIDAVAAGLGLRDDPARPLYDVAVEFLSARHSLVVLDNCEQLVVAAANLVEAWLRDCPNLRILITTREPLDIAGEAIVQVLPLTVPAPVHQPSPRGLARYDAVTLFLDRATAVVPGLDLSEADKSTVARICAWLDGLPLAIELAAARMRTLSPAQILERLDDRFTLLTRSSRTAPTRQKTLRWCIDWSYELCTEDEQLLWARLSVFAGGFELDAAEQLCGGDLAADDPLDVLSSLVDKSIVTRDESNGIVRFRMLDSIRDYGWQKLREFGADQHMRRRHRDWYQQLALAAEAEWISERQLYWTARLEREQPNLRDALECSLSEGTGQAADAALRAAAALHMFWTFRGLSGEGRRWIDRILNHPAQQSISDRVRALQVGGVMTAVQNDVPAAAVLVEEGRRLAAREPTPMNRALVDYADGVVALYRGEPAQASSLFEPAVEAFSSNRQGFLHVAALSGLAMVRELVGDTQRAIECYRELISITEACGESLFRASALWGMASVVWKNGERGEAIRLVENSLRVNQQIRSPLVAALNLEVLSWIAGADGDAERAAVLMGAAAELQRSMGNPATILPQPHHLHNECVRTTRSALGPRRFETALRKGRAMEMDEAVAYALNAQPADTPPTSGPGGSLTKRERQVADLVAQGLTNKQIAAKLVISQRTAEGHVEHILAKLGFTSRAQVAAWVAEAGERQSRRSGGGGEGR